MRRAFLLLILCMTASCGSNGDPSFEGTWVGTLPLIGNDCPFIAPLSQHQLFPVVITRLPDGQLNVVTADGRSGGGVEDKDNRSFLVAGHPFGTLANDAGNYSDCGIVYNFGFFDADDSSAQTELSIQYQNCSDTSLEDCGVVYAGEASKVK